MNDSPQPLNALAFRWEVDKPSSHQVSQWFERTDVLWRSSVQRLRIVATQYMAASSAIIHRVNQSEWLQTMVLPKAAAVWRSVPPTLQSHTQRLLPFLPLPDTAETSEEPDPVQVILSDFAALETNHQEMVAKNLALLWDHFQEMFGGTSGFLAASPTEQGAFLGKLRTATERMEPARGTDVAFHYVTVELMRQYVLFIHERRADARAMSLATQVVFLIDRGHYLARKPLPGPFNRHKWH